MTHIPYVDEATRAALQPILQATEAAMGFVPNSMLTMAHWPELLQGFGGFASVVLGPGDIEPGLKSLISLVASRAAGCRYCQAHTAHTAERRGESAARIRAAFEFETSPLFSAAERAALRVASRGATVPNGVEPGDMALLESHFTARQIVEIVAVISLFGFLNRWNDTFATTLEQAPRGFGDAQLSATGWSPGKHD